MMRQMVVGVTKSGGAVHQGGSHSEATVRMLKILKNAFSEMGAVLLEETRESDKSIKRLELLEAGLTNAGTLLSPF